MPTPQNDPRTCDVLVVGGGVAGLSAAAHLARDAHVIVIEAETALGYHSSGRSAAMFEPNYGAAPVTALSHASAAYLAQAHGGCLAPRGFMLVGTDAQDAVFARDMAALGTSEISVAEARNKVPILHPDRITRAAYHDAAHDIDTDRLLQGFARDLRAHGGTILTNLRVSQITRTQGQWEVCAGETIVTAPVLVNAAGAWADDLAHMAGVRPVGITPYRRSMARLPAPGGHDLRHWPMVLGAGETWYAKPDAGKLLVSPAEEDATTPHDAFADDLVLAEGLHRYSQAVTEPVRRVEQNWAGLRSFAPDRMLVLGRDPETPEFVWCAGQGGYGFQTAPAAGRLLGDLVAGRTPDMDADLVRALSPHRFI